MSYKLGPRESTQKAVRRIAREQIDRAVGEIDDPKLGTQASIHQVRKRCKKLRALVRLVRPAMPATYQRENAKFRDLARNLAGVRDEQALVEALERLLKTMATSDRRRFETVLERLTERRNAAAAKQDPDARLAEARKGLKKARQRVSEWRLVETGFDSVAGYRKTYKRGRKAAKEAFASNDAGDFHQWRKRVKYHMHQVQLLSPLWPVVHKAWRKEAKALSDILGDDHDLALLDELLASEGPALARKKTGQRLHTLIQREQEHLRSQAWELGRRLYAEKPKALEKRWRRYWESWQTAM